MKVSTVAQMRAMDRAAIEHLGIPEALLMENAGLAAYRVLADRVGVAGRTFVVVCGPGNNGGDGLVVARLIHANGGLARTFFLGDPARFQGAAQLNHTMAQQLGLELHAVEQAEDLAPALLTCDGVIDALLGTGIARPVEGLYRQVIEQVNASGKPVLSIDIPSGVNGDTGQVMGAAVRATWTVTFGLPKVGNLLYPGYAHCGQLYVTHISFPPALHQADDLQIALNDPLALPPRALAGHKGSFGQALFIAGASSYYGAPALCALSYLKAGGGYARLAAPRSMVPTLATLGPEIVFVPQDETAAGSIALSNLARLLELCERMDFVVMGPGLSLDPETQQLVRELVAQVSRPLLLDGDGITAVKGAREIVAQRAAPTVLTPHLGEMARLTGMDARAIDVDKVAVLRRTAGELNAVVVLKGAHTLIGEPGGRIVINLSGNSGMATAGSGDVLAGAIAAMHGLGLAVEDAVRMGVFVHGLAGDLAAATQGEDGITARDIMEALPAAVRACREGDPAVAAYAPRRIA